MGIIKNSVILMLDFILFYYAFGIEVSILLTSIILLYAWLGEYIALWKDGAIEINSLGEMESMKLKQTAETVAEQVKQLSGKDISKIKLYLIPTDVINAYSYGADKIGITRGTLQVSNGLELNSVFSHEVSHCLELDAMFHRIMFANVTIVMLLTSAFSAVIIAFLWIIFMVIGLFQRGGGWFSAFCANGITNIVKGMFQVLQYGILFVYKTAMGLISRSSEYRADKYSCSLGYSSQLSYFLSTFVAPQDERKRTIQELIYNSHPSTYKRIAKIRQYEQQEVSSVPSEYDY